LSWDRLEGIKHRSSVQEFVSEANKLNSNSRAMPIAGLKGDLRVEERGR
jgi:hypothetical protein